MNNKTSQTNQENYQLLTIDIETESTTEEKEHALIPHLNRITVIGVENVETGHTAVYRNLEEFKRDIWQDPEFKFLGHNFKWDFKNLTYHLGQLPAAGYSAYLHDTRAMAAICTEKVPESYLETYEAKRKKLNLLLPKGQGHREARGNSLKVLAPYFLGVDPFWETTTNHNNDTYVLQDVQYTTRLYRFLTQRLQELGQYDFYLKNMEWNRSAITPAEVNGLQLDAPNLIKLKEQLMMEERQLQAQIRGEWLPHMLAWEQKARDELQQEYQQMFEQAYNKPTKKPKDVAALQSKYAGLYHNSITKNPPKFNLDSPLQMKWLLKEQLNYNVTNLEGKESTGVEVLERLARTDETVSKLLKFRETQKVLTGFIPEYLAMQRPDGSINTNFNFDGTRTGRLSCSSINLQQTPKRLKSYFTARPGKLLATYDLGAIEPVILAYFSQDPNLCKLILAGESFHSINAITMFNLDCMEKEVKKLYPLLRDLAKTLGLAILYGAGVNRVVMAAAQAGVEISHSRAKEIVYGLRNYYRGVWEFKQELDQLLESGEVLFNLFGRPFKIENRDDVYMKGLNTLIQGSGSDLTQQAACDISKILGCTPLAFVHDSVVTEIDAAMSEELCNKIQYEFTKFKLPSQYGNLPLTVEGGAYECWD